MKYKLVIILDPLDRVISLCSFSDIMYAIELYVYSNCEDAVKMYGIDLCSWALTLYSDDILFLINSNVSSFQDKRTDVLGRKWIYCSQEMEDDWCSSYCVVRIEPLDENLVKEMLGVLFPHKGQEVISQYENCDYKNLINTPDMVAIFSEAKETSSVIHLLSSYLERKLANPSNFASVCKSVGEIVFNHIRRNRNKYSDSEVADISEEVKRLLLVRGKASSYEFRLRVIEDFLAAKYLAVKLQAVDPEYKCKWVDQIPLFKRVFRYLCALWYESEDLKRNVHFLEHYLTKFMDIKPSGSKKKERLNKSDVCRTNTDYTHERTFSKWPFLISIAEECGFQSDLMDLLHRLLVRKAVWVFKCKVFDDKGRLRALFKILEKIQLNSPLVIRIESGVHKDTLCNIWDMLTTIQGLCDMSTVEISVMHRQVPVHCDSQVSLLPARIAGVDKSIFITKYKGPFLCPSTPEFLKCHCMRNLEVLDITVYDLASLAEALSCDGLQNLKAVVIKVELRLAEAGLLKFQKLRLPSLSERFPLLLSVKYFDGFQGLLEKFQNKEQLETLTMHGVPVDKIFKLDMSAFTGLKALYIHFNPHVSQPLMKRKPSDAHYATSPIKEAEQPMDIDHSERKVESVTWPFELAVNSVLPKNLKRLMLRNTEFWNDSNQHFMVKLWQGNNVQRLAVLDSTVSVRGVRNILRSHVDGDISERLKRQRISRQDSGAIYKVKNVIPRLCKEEKDNRRQHKPHGKELIITSSCTMCSDCNQFPCKCKRKDGEDTRDLLEDVVSLLEDAYFYDILTLSYSSEIITVQKDVCGDLRVRCPLTGLTDDVISNFEHENWLKPFFEALVLAHYITLSYTSLTLNGAEEVVKTLIRLRKTVQEPFTLSISSRSYPSSEEMRGHKFFIYLRNESTLRHFKFCNSSDKSFYIRKTRDNQIFMNDEIYRQ